MTELRLFNSLTRQLEPFKPVHDGEARVYSCGPTVYNYPHIGNMRAYVFADTLGRVRRFVKCCWLLQRGDSRADRIGCGPER